MSQLAFVIEKAANAFARQIIGAVKGASLQELLTLQSDVARKRGRPAKAATAGKRGGRPAKTSVKATKKKADKVPAKKRRKINFPKCSVPGCGKNRYARGNGMCGAHFKASQAG